MELSGLSKNYIAQIVIIYVKKEYFQPCLEHFLVLNSVLIIEYQMKILKYFVSTKECERKQTYEIYAHEP